MNVKQKGICLCFAGIAGKLLKKNKPTSHGRLCLTLGAIAPDAFDIGDTFVQSVKIHGISTRHFFVLI
jgi:hypothetical protein